MSKTNAIAASLLILWSVFAGSAAADAPVEAASGASSEAQPPNIVYLMTDDQRWDNLGCYGRPEFITPHIDKLAEQGVAFDRAYYAVSICMPSRATAMTGRHLSSHKCDFSYPYDYSMSAKQMQDSYPAVLKKGGYRTGFVGKYGFTVTEKRKRPNRVSRRSYNVKARFGPLFDFFAGNGKHVAGGDQQWPEDDAVLAKIYDPERAPNERTLKSGDAMIRFLETQPEGQPFCLSVSFMAVKHDKDSRDVYPPHAKLFAGKEMTYPGDYVQGPNEKLPDVVKENWRGHSLHVKRSGVLKKYQDEVQDFATQAYSVDLQVGRLVEKLEAMGVLDNTVIIYTSDNGRFQGSHGLYDKGLLYEASVKAPLVVFDGRLPENQRGRRLDVMQSSVDNASTILGFAGLPAPAAMEGYDFSGLIRGEPGAKAPRNAVLMEHNFNSSMWGVKGDKSDAAMEVHNQKMIKENKSHRCRGVVTPRWKYFVYHEHTPKIEELYDLEKDPLEQDNLVAAPEHQETLKELREKCQAMYESVANRS